MCRRLSTQLRRFASAANIRGRLSDYPLYPFLAPSLPITVQRAAGSFNHHGTHKDFRPTNKLESSGLSLKDIVEQDVKDNPVILYMKGVPDLSRCGFSSLAVRVLKEYSYYGILTIDMPFADVPLSARNILEDPELKNAVKAYSLMFIGGSDIILNMHQTGLLKFATDRGRIYLSTSRRNFRGTDMLNNDHMMIMFLAVTSTFAMAMVPFARTATTVTMMYPIMTMMSSTVTITAATMSAITMTMLMNMMSPAMTVVLVNKMSPAVTVMPSDVTCCTSVMSTGAVVS
ncbi:unnamed protein product [Camellia sinensis]